MNEGTEKVNGVSAGEQLRCLREQKNLSIQEVASQLNLEVRVIEAIEQDRFEELPAATYVRGDLRSYAKVLGADAAGIISAYDDEAPEPPEVVPEVKHATQTSSSDKPVMAFTYLLTLTLVILLVAWWYSGFVVDREAQQERIADELDAAPPPGLPYEIPVVEHPVSPFYRAPVVGEESTDSTEDDARTQTMEAEPAAAQDTGEEEAYPAFVTNDEVGPDSLVLTLSEDSWIEVYDSLDRRIYIGLGHRGQVISLKGTAPFQVVLGFAEGVKVEFNGQTFDTGPHTNNTIARFSLGN